MYENNQNNSELKQMWRKKARVIVLLILVISWKMEKNNKINQPLTHSCPSTIVEYHDSHSLTHNKITVDHKLVTMGTCTKVTVVCVAMTTDTMVTVIM